MPNIIDILARALSLRQETALNSITPNRAGGIMYDTLLVLNQMQLEGGSLLISKVYASVSAMEADTTPTSDLTGRALKPGQLVVIVTSDSSSSDMGSEYRFNGPGSWTYVGKVGGLPLDTVPTQSSTKGITSGGVYTALAAIKAEGYKYMGLATPGSGGTAPGTPNQPVFYIAGPGSYPNFGSITVASGYLGFIKYSGGSWTVESVVVGKDYDSQISALDEQISQLEAEVDELVNGTYTDISPLSTVPYIVLRDADGETKATVTANNSNSVMFFPVESGRTYKINISTTRSYHPWGWCDTYLSSTPESDTILGGVASTDNTDSGNTYEKVLTNTGNYPYLAVSFKSGTSVTCKVLESGDLVAYFPQIKQDADKQIARENIGAASARDLSSVQSAVSEIKELTDYNLTETPEFEQTPGTKNGIIAAAVPSNYALNANFDTDYIPVKAGEHYRIVGNSATYAAFSTAIPANNVATPWSKTFATTAAANAYDFVFEANGYLGLSRPSGNTVTAFYLINNGVLKKLDGLLASTLDDSDIQFPNYVYCVYNPNRKVSQKIYFEGLLRKRDSGLAINGGKEMNVAKIGTPSSTKSSETKDIHISKLNEVIKSGQFNLIVTKSDNLVGKSIKHLAIGDSWAAQDQADLYGESEGPWNYASVVMNEFIKTEIDLGDNTAKMIQLGRTAVSRRNGHYKNQEYIIRSSNEGKGGWSACSFLRFPFSIRTAGAGTMSEKLAWDALGLGRKQLYGNTYDESAPYTAYVAGKEDRVKYLTEVAMGYYHWDYSTELLNYAGVTGSYTGTAEQKAAIDAKMEDVLNNPENPFYDWDTAISTNGDHAFSLAKYLERYKTLDDDGVTRLVIGSTAGTKITTTTQLNNFDICKPTHITIELGVNDYSGLTVQEKCDDIDGIVSAIHDYDSTIKVGIVNVHLLGLFYPELFTDKIATERVKDNVISIYFTALFDLNKKVLEEYPSEDGTSNTYAVPTHFVQGFTKVGARYGVTSDNLPIIIDGTDDLHPAINVCHDLGQQIWAWILYTLS